MCAMQYYDESRKVLDAALPDPKNQGTHPGKPVSEQAATVGAQPGTTVLVVSAG